MIIETNGIKYTVIDMGSYTNGKICSSSDRIPADWQLCFVDSNNPDQPFDHIEALYEAKNNYGEDTNCSKLVIVKGNVKRVIYFIDGITDKDMILIDNPNPINPLLRNFESKKYTRKNEIFVSEDGSIYNGVLSDNKIVMDFFVKREHFKSEIESLKTYKIG